VFAGVWYVTTRVLSGLVTLLVVSVLVFVAIHLVPGNYAEIVLGPFSSPQARATLTSEFGLNRPLPVQYLQWLGHVAVGDFGVSLQSGEPVTDIMARRIPVTAELALLATMFAVAIGIPLALAAGMARRRVSRGVSRLGGAIAMSTPDFVSGSVLVFVFSRYALGLPVGGYVPFLQSPAENLKAMVLPAVTLGVFGIAIVVRTGRDAVAGVMSSPHITAAVGRGESTAHIVRHHVMRNASIPVLTVLATYVGYLLGGAVIAENLFSLPGMGQAVLQGIVGRDYAIVQGTVLVGAAAFICVNTLADFTYSLLDPRIVQGARP
jgi:peptide/nickel transport system permease protein